MPFKLIRRFRAGTPRFAVGMEKDCRDTRELRDKVALRYEREIVQMTLALPKPKPQ